jgi:hypothetical protein
LLDDDSIQEWSKVKTPEIIDSWHEVSYDQPQVPSAWVKKHPWLEHLKSHWMKKMWRQLSEEARLYKISLQEEYDEKGLLVVTERLRPIYVKLVGMSCIISNSNIMTLDCRNLSGIQIPSPCEFSGYMIPRREDYYGTSHRTSKCMSKFTRLMAGLF